MVGAVDRVDEFKLNHGDYGEVTFYDGDVSGKELPKELSIKAREAEMQQVYKHKSAQDGKLRMHLLCNYGYKDVKIEMTKFVRNQDLHYITT